MKLSGFHILLINGTIKQTSIGLKQSNSSVLNMINPSSLVLLLAILPVLAVFVFSFGTFFTSEKRNGLGLARVASTTAFAFVVLAIIQRQFFWGQQQLGVVSSLRIGSSFQFELLQDRLSLFWLLVNSAVVTQILWFDTNLKRGRYCLSAILILALFAVMQLIVVTNDARWQWMLISLSNWLLYANLAQFTSSDETHSRPTQSVIFLTVADLFWMLGLLGIYLVTGSLDISLVTSEGLFVDASDSATSLLITSVMSLFISLIIRCGFFPVMIWTNDFISSRTSHAMLWAFPISIGGYLLFRWLPILTLFSEPLTLLIGFGALSAVLLAVSALFQSDIKQRQRLGSVLISFAVIGVAADPALWPQMAALFAGTILFMITLSYQQTAEKSVLNWGLLLILLCGTFGVEAVFREMGASGGANAAEIPPVMYPLLVITMGLFLYGSFQQFHVRGEKVEEEPIQQTNNLFWGLSLLILFQAVPFFLSPETQYELLIPLSMIILLAVSISISLSIESMGGLNSFELGSLVKLCKEDYYLPIIVKRGIAIPIKIGALFIHFIDQYLVQGLMIQIPNWLMKEIRETSQEIETNNTKLTQCRAILMVTVILILAVWL